MKKYVACGRREGGFNMNGEWGKLVSMESKILGRFQYLQ